MDGSGDVISEKTRIYVGGLGAGVTEDDLRKTFSALGEVVSVDVVRTKDRSFAYLDFLPASDKSLPKLFSTYNGCMWKGGKLRLEKAKEHYLVKLKREWQQESEHASKALDNSNTNATESHDTSEKPKKPSPTDNTQIHIFFPKLGKVKSLAQVGIGKHKYSFQRLQIPSTPTHFCDCEEHSVDFPPPNKKPSSEIDNGSYEVNEQELNIMNSVMNKIFERENPSKQVIEGSEFANAKDEGVADETDEEDHLTDEDNLIINVANKKKDSVDLLAEMRAIMVNQVQAHKKLNTSTKRPNSVNDNPQKETAPLVKKRKSSHAEETSRNSRARLNTQENKKKEAEIVTKQPGNESLRSLKSTWKGLIGQKRDTSFNFLDFFASIPQRKEEEVNSDKNGPGPRPETEVGEVYAENKTLDIIIANDCEQNEEEPKVDNVDLPLTTTGQQFRISDVDQKEEEPKSDEFDSVLENNENDQELKEPTNDSHVKNDEDLKKPTNDSHVKNDEDSKKPTNDSHVKNDEDSKKPTNDSHVKNDEDLIKTARGEFWRHKSSWTQLISTASHTSFSISHIIPDKDIEKHEKQEADTFDSQPPNKNLDDQIPVVKKEAALPPVKKNISEKRRILSLGKLESDETCSFMRTEESVKEWKKAKASSSGSLNKKKRLANESA